MKPLCKVVLHLPICPSLQVKVLGFELLVHPYMEEVRAIRYVYYRSFCIEGERSTARLAMSSSSGGDGCASPNRCTTSYRRLLQGAATKYVERTGENKDLAKAKTTHEPFWRWTRCKQFLIEEEGGAGALSDLGSCNLTRE